VNEEKQKRIEFTDMGSEKLADEISDELDGGAADDAEQRGARPQLNGDPEDPGEPPSDGAADAGTREHPAAEERAGFLRSEETVGEMLLAAREKLGQSLEVMSQETKIPKQMLQYLETDNFEALPAKVYVKSFLRTYADALGLDTQHILNKYELQTGQTHRTKGDHWEIETDIVEEKIRSPVVLRRFIIPAIVIAAGIVIIVKWAGRTPERAVPPAPIDLREELLERPAATQTVQAPPARSEAQEEPAAREPMELRISASPTDSCYIELETVSIIEQQPENALFKFTLQPGRYRTFQATEEFRFRKIGNAGGIVLELNGNKLATLGKKGKIITNYAVTRENLPRSERGE
jgi:hypothetical protein